MSEGRRPIEIGVDTGGTFTDCVILNFARRSIMSVKVLSTPEDPSVAIFQALELAFDRAGIAPRDIGAVLHATTVATNTLIERKGAKVGLITTEGFRDMLEMRRETRYDETDLFPKFPEPLVPRYLRLGVIERTDEGGAISHRSMKTSLRSQLCKLSDEGVETVAISFLHSYANPAHELAAAAMARDEFAFEAISASCEVRPEMREYERTSRRSPTPISRRPSSAMWRALPAACAAAASMEPLYVMQSNGGFAGPDETSKLPVRMVELGPAAGTIAALFHGHRAGYRTYRQLRHGRHDRQIRRADRGYPAAADRRTGGGEGAPLQGRERHSAALPQRRRSAKSVPAAAASPRSTASA